jgi:heme/copper-type cytochrome/quinol oxidase subunit 4
MKETNQTRKPFVVVVFLGLLAALILTVINFPSMNKTAWSDWFTVVFAVYLLWNLFCWIRKPRDPN